MNTNLMKTSLKSVFAATTVAALSIATAHAQVIVNFGGDYVTTTTPGNYSWTGGGGGDYVVAFSNTTQLSPTSGYTGPTYYGGAFRGSWTVSTAGNTNVVNAADGTNDAIQLDNGAGTTAANTGYAGLVIFRKADFLNGGNTNQVDITSSSSFTARGTNAQNTGALDVRWVLRLSDNTYVISQLASSTFGNSNSYTTINSGDLTALSWFTYDPVTSVFNIGSATTPTFTDIQAVGVWFGDTTNSVNARYQGRLSIFTADVTIVPEPTTWVLLAGSLATLVFIRRRRRA